MIKKIIIFTIIVILIWAGAIYFNSKNQVEEIIIGDDTNQIDNTNNQKTLSESSLQKAVTYCGQENVSAVYASEDKIKVVSTIPGAGSTYISPDGSSSFTCPVVGPDSMSEECKAIMTIDDKDWVEVCME